MNRQEREEWAEWARPLVEELRESVGVTALAEETGVNRQTIYDLMKGSTPATKTVQRLDPVLKESSTELTSVGIPASERADITSGEGWKADPQGSPAEQLINTLQNPELLRRFAGTPTMKDVVKSAFAIAVDEDFAEEEMDKLQAWRRDVLSQEGE